MSKFIDLLRQSRSSPTSVLHKFLTNYDSKTRRVYAFVEGAPDRIFYEAHLSRYTSSPRDIFVYNCEGKAKVYQAFKDVMARYPDCTRVLFFVDKDVDDILGKAWPSNPRIFTTECYSIENYLIGSDSLIRYFDDFIKIRRVEIDFGPLQKHYQTELLKFYKLILPVMAWVVLMRRNGYRVMLADVKLNNLFLIRDSVITNRPKRKAILYLHEATDTKHVRLPWRNIRSVYSELGKIEPSRYVRGKFAAWCFVSFANTFLEDIGTVVREGGGSISQTAQISEGNFIQLLAPRMPTPAALDEFLRFHIPHERHAGLGLADDGEKRAFMRRLRNLFRSGN